MHRGEHERGGPSEVVLKLPQVLRRTQNTVVLASFSPFHSHLSLNSSVFYLLSTHKPLREIPPRRRVESRSIAD